MPLFSLNNLSEIGERLAAEKLFLRKVIPLKLKASSKRGYIKAKAVVTKTARNT